MTSYIIVTTDEAKARNKADEISDLYAISKYDRAVISGDKETSLGIELVKKMQEKVFLKPLKSKQKAIIIPKAQLLTLPAQNALLKLLEEPPEHTLIFLLTDNLDTLIPTVQSRCQTITFETDERSITTDEKEKMMKDLKVWLKQDIGGALKAAEQLAKENEKAIATLEEMILIMREEMLQVTSNSHHVSLIAQQLKIMHETLKTLRSTNTNPRIALEYLLLFLRTDLVQ